MCENWTLHEQRDYAWDYFKVHAQQRMALFNFFVVFSSLAATGLGATLQDTMQAHVVGVALGALLILISCIFSKLDRRAGFFIKHAESALKLIEGTFSDEQHEGELPFKLFTAEEAHTREERNGPWYRAWERHLTYSECFRLTFWAFGIIGAIGILLSVGLLIGQTTEPQPSVSSAILSPL